MAHSQISTCAIVGPTGIGKTALALILSDTLDLEVISVDSRQVYRHMDIGTGKPDRSELKRVRHHLIDVAEPDDTYSAGRFSEEARISLENIQQGGKIPFLVGGTGLYLKALTEGIINAPPSDPSIRADLNKEAKAIGAPGLHEKLKAIDPAAAGRIHPNDLVRTVRALEINRLTGKNVGDLRCRPRQESLDAVIFGLWMQREYLYRRIEARVDLMMKNGFLEEVRSLLEMGYDENLRSMEGIGYRQLTEYLRGLHSLSGAVDSTKKETRNFAKRQMTWFSSMKDVNWIEVPPSGALDKAAETILKCIYPGCPSASAKREP